MRTLARAPTEEYSEHGVYVANAMIDGLIGSPGTRGLPIPQKWPDGLEDAMVVLARGKNRPLG